MKKLMIIAAVAATVLTSCVKTENPTSNGHGTPVGFGVYVPQTKAGAAGQTTTTSIQRSEANGGGFGVFAYYTNDAAYAGTTKPNFMYNQGVFYNDPNWEYSPVKYWPNEYGTGANSAAQDKLSFFAYAPYVSAGSGSYGITAMSPNSANGDPTITYVIDPTPSTAVDLCWAVNSADGFPWIDLTKQAYNGKVTFLFKHALARFNVNVRGYFDAIRTVDGAISSDDIDSNTKITIEKIEIAGTFAPSGVLNLNNTTANEPLWTPAAAAATTLTIPNADIAASLKATVNGETSFPAITGVTKTNVNVFTGNAPAKTDATYYTFIPTDDDITLNVKITYYVTTRDPKLADQYICVKNVINKDITFAGGFTGGLNYNLNIVLGMTTVKLEATVADWADPSNVDIDLPVNL
ncbi:MAG: hypothetical protein J6X89_01255 [Bacteroidales bacterium]|nr:hypothetical protein [Bacteroidales bacterium]